MSHPFEKMFDKALKNSSDESNEVLNVAEMLLKKGYRAEEISTVLKRLQKALIDKADADVVLDAIEEFSGYVEE